MLVEHRERRLLILATVFLLLYALVLTLSPAVREGSWNVQLRTSHWIGVFVWLIFVFGGATLLGRTLPGRDPYVLPLCALLSGWGILTIWRLDPSFGARQAVWLGTSIVAGLIIAYGIRDLDVLRRYKYVLLTFGLLLTTLTLILGTNPTGEGPRLWLGCCGVYFQPSEPLRLLLVVYLAAFLADRAPLRERLFPLLLPTLFVTGLALALLLVQRDLGTACIFILLHTTVLYLATGKRRVLLATAAALVLAAITGFLFENVVHARLESWLNPWNDPAGQSYQVIQSLMAVANGGVFGRGPGLGSPGLVPVAHSDFIFSAMAEETGLVGEIGLLTIYALLFSRGLLIALRAGTRFDRLLAAGLTAYLAIQTLVIIGGNVRLLPLTGVTLPFVSYGGSSLLTAFVAMTLLLVISNRAKADAAPLSWSAPYTILATVLGIAIVLEGLTQAWWSMLRAPDLLARTDNPRRSIADRYVPRGDLVDRGNQPIDVTVGTSGSYRRDYLYPALGPVVGYTHPAYGQAGLEASLDDYLRGLQGNPASLIAWDQLLSGFPPPGIDVKLSLDLGLQARADGLLASSKGAIVLLDARSGEILAMASHPTYNPNQLDELGASLAKDINAPLLNRATQGQYMPGTVLAPFVTAAGVGYAAPSTTVSSLYRKLGFYAAPSLRMPVAVPSPDGTIQSLHLSPLQMAIAASTLSNGGARPVARIALAVNTPQQGWIVLSTAGIPTAVFPSEEADGIAGKLRTAGNLYWEWLGSAGSGSSSVTWYIGGTPPQWQGTPLSLAVLLESNDAATARRIGEDLLQRVTSMGR